MFFADRGTIPLVITFVAIKLEQKNVCLIGSEIIVRCTVYPGMIPCDNTSAALTEVHCVPATGTVLAAAFIVPQGTMKWVTTRAIQLQDKRYASRTGMETTALRSVFLGTVTGMAITTVAWLMVVNSVMGIGMELTAKPSVLLVMARWDITHATR